MMTSVYVLNFFSSFLVGTAESQPELLGVFSTYSLAWETLERHAKEIVKSELDLSAADMGAILLRNVGDSEYGGGYSLTEEILDKALIVDDKRDDPH